LKIEDDTAAIRIMAEKTLSSLPLTLAARERREYSAAVTAAGDPNTVV
jgi:hypothetical protein